MNPNTEKDYLTHFQYRDGENLNARIQIHRGSEPIRGLFRLDVHICLLSPGMNVLEVGCGPVNLDGEP